MSNFIVLNDEQKTVINIEEVCYFSKSEWITIGENPSIKIG